MHMVMMQIILAESMQKRQKKAKQAPQALQGSQVLVKAYVYALTREINSY